jgi:hypothetical protein
MRDKQNHTVGQTLNLQTLPVCLLSLVVLISRAEACLRQAQKRKMASSNIISEGTSA